MLLLPVEGISAREMRLPPTEWYQSTYAARVLQGLQGRVIPGWGPTDAVAARYGLRRALWEVRQLASARLVNSSKFAHFFFLKKQTWNNFDLYWVWVSIYMYGCLNLIWEKVVWEYKINTVSGIIIHWAEKEVWEILQVLVNLVINYEKKRGKNACE